MGSNPCSSNGVSFYHLQPHLTATIKVMKTVLFVPGFMEDLKSRDYATVLKAIQKKGYRTVFVPIRWRYTTPDNWDSELEKVYERYDANDTILAGFSFGAVTAFLAATKRNPSELWLFSLSSYFAEDTPKMKKSWLRLIGKRRAEHFRKLSFNDKATAIDCKTLIFVGENEILKYPSMGERASAANDKIKCSRLIKVSDTGHDVADIKYIEAIEKHI